MKRVRIKRNRIAMYKHNLRIAMDLHFISKYVDTKEMEELMNGLTE